MKGCVCVCVLTVTYTFIDYGCKHSYQTDLIGLVSPDQHLKIINRKQD